MAFSNTVRRAMMIPMPQHRSAAAPGTPTPDQAAFLEVLATGLEDAADWYDAADNPFTAVCDRLARADQIWLLRCIGWMRQREELAPAAIVAAAITAHARLQTGVTDNRTIIGAVLRRADEPGLLLRFWIARYGRPVPKAVQRGVADAVTDLYAEPGAAELDGSGAGLPFREVLSIARPKPPTARHAALFRSLAEVHRTSPAAEPARPSTDPKIIELLRAAANGGSSPF